ncbi:MAG: homocysteine S-methyltransferase family protein [Pseudomonadota bacterium]
MGYTILDGGMGQELLKRHGGKPTPLWATQVMIEAPEHVVDVHDAFFAAGAEIATTNTYAILRDRLLDGPFEHQFQELHELGCSLAVEARDRHGSGMVAGALGPLGQSYVGDQGPPLAEAAALYGEISRIHAPMVDLYLAETVPSLARARGVLEGTLSHGKPVWLAVTVDDVDGSKLRSGEPLVEVLELRETWPFDVLLVNCSLPEAVTKALETLDGASVPLGAYANGFIGISRAFLGPKPTADTLETRKDLGPDAYCGFAERWAEAGAVVLGGCCEVGPDHIRVLADRFADAPEIHVRDSS